MNSKKKKSSHMKKLKKDIAESNERYLALIDKIAKDYKKILIEEKNNLISRIASGEDLDEVELRKKYLDENLKKKLTIEVDESSEEILHKIIINGETYYHELKNDGIIYNKNSVKVGVKKDGKFPEKLELNI